MVSNARLKALETVSIDGTDWDILEQMVKVMSIVSDKSKLLESDTCITASMVLPAIVSMVYDGFQNLEIGHVGRDFADAIRMKTFTFADDVNQFWSWSLAAWMDPRFCNIGWLESTVWPHPKQWEIVVKFWPTVTDLKNAIEEHLALELEHHASQKARRRAAWFGGHGRSSTLVSGGCPEPRTPEPKRSWQLGSLFQHAVGSGLSFDALGLAHYQNLVGEYTNGAVQRLTEKDMRWDVCISAWWRKIGVLYPLVEDLARCRLCVQASLATSERALSKAGLNDTKSRMSLLADEITHIIGLSWELVASGWGSRDLDGEKAARGAMLTKVWMRDHDAEMPAPRRSPHLRASAKRRGSKLKRRGGKHGSHPTCRGDSSTGRVGKAKARGRAKGRAGEDVQTPRRSRCTVHGGSKGGRREGRRGVVDVSDSSDDPEYQPSDESSPVPRYNDAFAAMDDDPAPRDVIVGGRRLTGDELHDFQVEYLRDQRDEQ